MSNSKLVNYTKISPNSNPRKDPVYNPTGKVTKITIHHTAGKLSIENMGADFAREARQASSNYGVGDDGRIALYVEENRRAWTSGSRENDYLAVTIEVVNSASGGNWPVSDIALARTIDLCVDICQRNGIKQLNFTGDKSGNLTMHKWFQPTGCPGPYLESKFPYIAQEVNKRLKAAEPSGVIYRVQTGAFSVEANADAQLKKVKAAGFKDAYKVYVGGLYKIQVGAFTVYANAERMSKDVKAAGFPVFITTEGGDAVPAKPEQKPAKLAENGLWDTNTTIRLQQIFGTPVDGVVSNQWASYKASNPGLLSGWDWQTKPNGQGSSLIKAMQKWAGMPANAQDGEFGPATCRAFQKKLGTFVDGTVSNPSDMVKALQKWANGQ